MSYRSRWTMSARRLLLAMLICEAGRVVSAFEVPSLRCGGRRGAVRIPSRSGGTLSDSSASSLSRYTDSRIPWRSSHSLSCQTSPHEPTTVNATITALDTSTASRPLILAPTNATQEVLDATQVSMVPSYSKLLVFMLGTVAIWLREPLLSLVDTTVVGMSGSSTSVVALAAMGPATVLNDISLYSTYFLALATTSQLTAACHSRQWAKCQEISSHLMGVALVTGTMVSILLWTMGPSILTNMIMGSSTSNAASVAAAVQMTDWAIPYCRIRALAAPAAVLNMVAQAVCLATVDVTTPVVAVVTASLLNLAGDVAWRHDRLAGVATATALASLASCTILVTAVIRKLQQWRRWELEDAAIAAVTLSNVNDATTVDTATATLSNVNDAITVDTASANAATTKAIPWVSLPRRVEFWQLVKLSLPLAFNMWTKMACYFALTWKATDFGATAMASHNILMRIFFFFGCFGDALSQTAQSYLPATLYPQKRPRDFFRICRRLGVISVGVAAFNYGASRSILCHGAQIFTSDAGIVECLRATSIWTAWALALHPVVVSISGTVIATRNFANLVKVYTVTAVVHFGMLYRATSFANVWQALLIFQMVRLVNYLVWTTVTPARPPALDAP